MKKLTIFILFLMISLSCKKVENTKENLTSEEITGSETAANPIGLSKISFKVNGKLIECTKGVTCMSTPGHGPKGSNPDDNAIIQGGFGNNNKFGIGFILLKDNSAKHQDGRIIGNMMLTIDGKNYMYVKYWDKSEKASVTVTKAEKAVGGGGIPIKKLSGTFEGVLKADNGDKIVITDGKFSS